jgi:hypothetical protein
MLRCEFIKSDGTVCGSPVVTGRRFCYFHDDPKTVELRLSRSAKGGRVSRSRPEVVGSWTSKSIKNQEDIRMMLSELANEIGNYSGEKAVTVDGGLFNPSPGIHWVGVVADGDWSIKMTKM